MNGKEFNWNQEYSTINLYPSLNPTITFKFILSSKIIARRTLYMQDFFKEGKKECIFIILC